MSTLFSYLIKIKAVKKKNIILFSSESRDKKINIYRDRKSKVIFIKGNVNKLYYQNKSLKNDLSILKKLNLKKQNTFYNLDTKRRIMSVIKSKKYNLLDIGSGNGDFLKISKKYFHKVVGVEPNTYQSHLLSKKFKIYKSVDEIKEKYSVISLFHVLEHVADQISFLTKIKKKLKSGGYLFIEIPHAEDLMLDFNSYKKFILWSEHRVLHTKKSISKLLRHVGFAKFSVKFIQRYNANNHLGWLLNSMPGGHEKTKLVNNYVNNKYIKELKKRGKTDTLFIKVQNN